MRRNDVVISKNRDLHAFYGRVIRIVGDHALWVDCGLNFCLTPIDQLEVVDYKGRYEWAPDGRVNYYHRDKNGNIFDLSCIKYSREPRFERMPTLRKLKQRASVYAGRNAWKTSLDYEYLNK